VRKRIFHNFQRHKQTNKQTEEWKEGERRQMGRKGKNEIIMDKEKKETRKKYWKSANSQLN
jgi:hypothetical protein